MKIEKIDHNRILIILSDDELSDFGLKSSDLGKGDMKEKRFLNNMLGLAEIKTGISIRGQHIVLENKPFAGGCMLLIKVRRRTGLKFKLYKPAGIFLFLFDDPRRLFSCAALLDKADIHLSSRLFRREDGYILFLPKNKRSRSVLTYLDLFGVEEIPDEYSPTPLGIPLCKKDAIGFLAAKVRNGGK